MLKNMKPIHVCNFIDIVDVAINPLLWEVTPKFFDMTYDELL
jgi:hypothetical protein